MGIARGMCACVVVGSLLLGVGCQEKRTYILNPDGSGKVLVESALLDGDSLADRMRLASSFLERSKGVDAWSDAGFDDGDKTPVFRATALFPDLSKLTPAASPFDSQFQPTWKIFSDGTAELTVSLPRSRAKGEPADLSDEQIAELVKASRAKPLFSEEMPEELYLRMQCKLRYRVPGKVLERTNFTLEKDGSLSITLDGHEIVRAMKAIRDSDKDMRELALAGQLEGGPMKTAMLCRELFGQADGFRAKIQLADKPTFDYAAEVAEARKTYLQTMAKVGLYWETIPEGLDETFASITQGKTDPKGTAYTIKDSRPFVWSDGGYILRMTADDGTLLLPRAGVSQKVGGSLHRDGLLITVPPDASGKRVPAKDVLGVMFYTSADVEEVDLGFSELKVGAKGKALGARIAKIRSTSRDGKPYTTYWLAYDLPAESDLRSIELIVPEDAKPDGFKWEGSTKGEIITVSGDVPAGLDFRVTIWKNVKHLTIPFHLTDVPETPKTRPQGAI